MNHRGLCIIYRIFALNLLILGVLAGIRNMEPISKIRLTTQADSVVVYGLNAFGLYSIKVFPTMKETQNYLNQNGYRLPIINYVEPIKVVNLSLSPIKGKRYYRLEWKNNDDAGNPLASYVAKSSSVLLHAPDAEAAMLMYENISHSNIVAGQFGFSIPLAN